jgi:hypothetical protein
MFSIAFSVLKYLFITALVLTYAENAPGGEFVMEVIGVFKEQIAQVDWQLVADKLSSALGELVA